MHESRPWSVRRCFPKAQQLVEKLKLLGAESARLGLIGVVIYSLLVSNMAAVGAILPVAAASASSSRANGKHVAPMPAVLTGKTAGKRLLASPPPQQSSSQTALASAPPPSNPSSPNSNPASPLPGGLVVSVAFADDSSVTANFPAPWQGAARTSFIGSGAPFKAGAIRIDNPTSADISVDNVRVDLQRSNAVFNYWSAFTVPAGGSVILTQTAPGNFDTSAFPISPCGVPADSSDTRIPKVTVTVAGNAIDLLDTAHVLDTGGFTLSCRGNESLQWRPIGTTGIESPSGSLSLGPATSITEAGVPVNLTATALDADGQPLPNVNVNFAVQSGPTAGMQGQVATNATGAAVFSYSGSTVGTDVVQAHYSNTTGGLTASNEVTSEWSTAGVSVAAPGSMSGSELIYNGQTSAYFNDSVLLAAQLLDASGNAIVGRGVSFSFGPASFSATTDANGVARAPATADATGTQGVTASFAGDA